MNESLYDLLKDCAPMLSFELAVRLCNLLGETKDVPGDVVEFGCFEGRTALLMSKLKHPNKTMYLYDSFQGLPDIPTDEHVEAKFFKGAMRAKPIDVLKRFADAGQKDTIITGKWFADLHYRELPEAISFAHIDCDISTSITEALTLVYPRLSAGAICVIDDYGHAGLPGVRKAVDAFFHVNCTLGKCCVDLHVEAGQAWFRK